MGDSYEVIRRSHIEQGLVVTNFKPGCKMNVYATGIESDGTLGPIRSLVASIDIDHVTEGCKDALFYTFIVEHADDVQSVREALGLKYKDKG